ncbi:MAG: hypothetical protein M1530_01460 [Candidatus Marsarchaeota archaeon]|nr:hypothetical protein [Candidatus Marsarchaeota archaeon]
MPAGWVLVRASGTENQVRIFAEGRSLEEAEGLAKRYQSMVKKEMDEQA